MDNNIKNIRVEANVYTKQTSIFIVDCTKMPKIVVMITSLIYS